MKKTNPFGWMIAMALVPSAVSGSESFTSDDLLEATRVSIETFKTSNPSHAEHVSGFKTWKSGSDSKVKLYVSHDGMTMEYNYACSNQGGRVRCVSQ